MIRPSATQSCTNCLISGSAMERPARTAPWQTSDARIGFTLISKGMTGRPLLEVLDQVLHERR